MIEPRTSAGRALLARSPDLRDTVLAIEAEASAVDDERLARALIHLWPTRHGRDIAGLNARAIAVAYNTERDSGP